MHNSLSSSVSILTKFEFITTLIMSATLSKNTIAFLEKLAENNNREWFNENKNLYLEAQQNVLDFVTELLDEMSEFDENLAKLDPKKTLFRIYRDTRFSLDKSPYKTNIGASINGIGKKDGSAGYYLHIEPGKAFLAAGVYMCDPKRLKKIRQEISSFSEEFSSIVNHKDFKKFELMDEKLSRVPQGFEKDDPMAEFLKMKHFVVTVNLKDEDLLQKDAVTKFSAVFKKMEPFVKFLNSVE